jgi:hypothetical protein
MAVSRGSTNVNITGYQASLFQLKVILALANGVVLDRDIL